MTGKMPASFKLPPLDTARLESEEQAAVAASLAGLPFQVLTAEERLQIAATIVNEATTDLEAHRRVRDAMALSLRLYDGARAVNHTLGISRTAFVEKCNEALRLTDAEKQEKWLLGPALESAEVKRTRIAERASASKVRQVPTEKAKRQLPRIAEKAYRAAARRDAAMPTRDAAIRELLELGWSREQVAEAAGVLPSRISQVHHGRKSSDRVSV